VCKTLSQKYLIQGRAGGMAQVVELSKHEALNSNSSTTKKKKKVSIYKYIHMYVCVFIYLEINLTKEVKDL
jgi:hypothetical protein